MYRLGRPRFGSNKLGVGMLHNVNAIKRSLCVDLRWLGPICNRARAAGGGHREAGFLITVLVLLIKYCITQHP